MIGLIAATAGGRAAAAQLAASWPGQTRSYDGPPRQALPQAWAQCDGLVCFLAVGATVRLIAPLLDSKWTDPAVVCVDESAHHAVAVVGGHAAGANALAARVAAEFGADVVITTATDTVSLPGLGVLGWPTEGAVGVVSRALLDGERVRLQSEWTWPLPPLPDTVGDAGDYRILITDRLVDAGPRTAVLRPPSLVMGVDVSTGVTEDEVLRLAGGALAEAGLSAACVAAVAAADASAGEPGLRKAARLRGWPLVSYPAGQLDTAAALQRCGGGGFGPASAAEAVALAGASELVLPERRVGRASVAVARVWPRGRLALVGTGPGARDLLSPRAIAELRRASVVACLGQSRSHISDLLRSGSRVLAAGPGEEQEDCARAAVRAAQQGHAVAVALPAEAGLQALAGLILELAGDVEVVEVPEITTWLAAAAVPGSPPGEYSAIISPGQRTPWEVIERQVRAVANADYVITFCPSGGCADRHIGEALAILRRYRPPDTPVAVLRGAQRPGQQVGLETLASLDPATVDSHCTVIIGSSRTRVVAGRMVTPAGG